MAYLVTSTWISTLKFANRKYDIFLCITQTKFPFILCEI